MKKYIQDIAIASKATTVKIQEARELLASLYSNDPKVVKQDLQNVLMSKDFNEYKLNDGFFEKSEEFYKVKHQIELFPFIYSQFNS
jgi:hypothetical protein